MRDQADAGLDQRKTSPVIGKVSIGIPSDEPMLVNDRLVGKKLARDLVLSKGRNPVGIGKGTVMTERHVQQVLDAGIDEVLVLLGAFPTRLDHFRLVRQAAHHGGYLFDPALYEKYGLDEGFTECPIILTSNDIAKVVRSQLVNYDRAEKCVFCTSSDGETARRLQADPENGGYQEGYYEVECIPFHDDPRRNEGKAVCEFRKHGAKLPCKFAGSLSFQILPKNPDVGFDLARYFKMETTSAESGAYWTKNLLDEVMTKFGRIAFVPLKLAVVKENAVYYDGTARRDTQVVRTTISVDPEYLDRYLPVVERQLERLRTYRKMGSGFSTDEVALDAEGFVDMLPRGRHVGRRRVGLDGRV